MRSCVLNCSALGYNPQTPLALPAPDEIKGNCQTLWLPLMNIVAVRS